MAEGKEALRDTGAHAGSRGIPAAARVLTPQQLPHGLLCELNKNTLTHILRAHGTGGCPRLDGPLTWKM